MAGKLVVDRQGRQFRLIAHLDTSKTIAGGAPDPDYVFEQTWTADPGPTSETAPERTARLNAFESAIKADFRRNAADALARKAPQATPASLLAGAGEVL